MNNKDYIIRLENKSEYKEVENLTREAFVNVNIKFTQNDYLIFTNIG